MQDEESVETMIKEVESEEDKSVARMLVNLVLECNIQLFHDQFDTGFIAIHGSNRKILKLRSRGFKTWLSNLAWQEVGKAASASSVETAIRTLEGQAVHENEEIQLHVRLAKQAGNVWYDLGNGKAVQINKDSWQIAAPAPILFYRFAHQRPQTEPLSGSSLEKIYDFIPTPKDQRQKLLLLVWLVAALLPDFPHPILVVHGPQGSRKTTLFKLLRRLVDPSIMETLTTHGDTREYVQLASHHYLLPLDNLSPIRAEFSDMLCRTVTGDGMSKRELYSDDDDIIYSFRRVVAMNGINLVVSKPDLLERSLIIELERPAKYEEEAALMSKFEEFKPYLLGALFDMVRDSIRLFQQIELPADIGNFRMADFVRWGCAISQALGHTTDEFIQALVHNLLRQNSEAIDDSPVAQVVLAFMEDKNFYRATPTELLNQFQTKAIALKIDIKQKEFPKNSNWLWRRLQVVATNLLALGIKIEKEKDGARLISLSKVHTNVVNGVSGVQQDSSDNNELHDLDSKDSTDSI
jgi:energy-coupling factor transporter ATP-binding protein EcfA2